MPVLLSHSHSVLLMLRFYDGAVVTYVHSSLRILNLIWLMLMSMLGNELGEFDDRCFFVGAFEHSVP